MVLRFGLIFTVSISDPLDGIFTIILPLRLPDIVALFRRDYPCALPVVFVISYGVFLREDISFSSALLLHLGCFVHYIRVVFMFQR